MLRDDDHSPVDAHGRDSSERSRLDPFVVATGDAAPRDQRDIMERPFFSLAKAKRTAPILYESAGVRVEVFAGADVRWVLPASSRGVLAAGPDVAALRAACASARDEVEAALTPLS